MPSFIPAKFNPVQLDDAAPTIIGTTPANAIDTTILIQVSNTSNNPREVKLWIYPAGGEAEDSNNIIGKLKVKANMPLPIKNRFVMKPGDILAGQDIDGDGASLTVSTSLVRRTSD